jgi:ferredoxin-NADP reductase
MELRYHPWKTESITPGLRSKRPLANHTVEYLFSHDEPDLHFRPGQFLSLRVGDRCQRSCRALRSYSIASSPEQRGELLLVLRLVEDGVGSQFFAAMAPGDPISFTGPMGFFVNELSHPGDVVYVATGRESRRFCRC